MSKNFLKNCGPYCTRGPNWTWGWQCFFSDTPNRQDVAPTASLASWPVSTMTAPPTCTRPIPPEFTPNGSPMPSDETQRLFESFSKKIWPRKRWRRRGEQLNWWVRMLVQSLSTCSGGVCLADMSSFIVVDMFRLFTHVGILLWGSEYGLGIEWHFMSGTGRPPPEQKYFFLNISNICYSSMTYNL